MIPPDTDVVLYDYFRGVLCLEKDGFAPPERYLKIFRGDDVYIETYDVGDSRRISISFTKEEVEKGLTRCKREAAMGNGYTNSNLVSMTFPSDEFDKVVFGRGIEGRKDAEDKDTDG